MVVLAHIGFAHQPDIFNGILLRGIRSQLKAGYRPLFGRPSSIQPMQELPHGALSMIRYSIPDHQQPLSRIVRLQLLDKPYRVLGIARRVGRQHELSEENVEGAVIGLSLPRTGNGQTYPLASGTPYISTGILPKEMTFIHEKRPRFPTKDQRRPGREVFFTSSRFCLI